MKSDPASKLQPIFLALGLLLAVAGAATKASGQRMPEADHGPSLASRAHLVGKPEDYVGWQTCAGCHRAEAESFVKTIHAPAEGLPTSPASTAVGLSASAETGK